MAQNDPRYAPVAASLPDRLPPISRLEAERAARGICRAFGKVALGGPSQLYPVRFTGTARRCWISPHETTGHYKGWGRLIHDLSHRIFERRHPTFRPHDGGHATLEREIAEYVVRAGWLDGRLKSKQKPKPDVRAVRYQRVCERLDRWQAKLRRAQTAIRKLSRAKRRYDAQAHTVEVAS